MKSRALHCALLLILTSILDICCPPLALPQAHRDGPIPMLKPVRVTTFNSSGLITAGKINLAKGFADRNIPKAVIDFSDVPELLCTSSGGDGNEEIDMSGHHGHRDRFYIKI